MYITGIKPGEVYDSTDRAQGKGFKVGTRGVDSDGKEYVMVLVAASQNLVTGTVVTLGVGATFNVATILASAAPTPGANVYPVGVCVTSITASASTYIWAQVYGTCQALFSDTTASNIPGYAVTPCSVPGAIKGSLATASSFIEGIVMIATTTVAGLGNVFLSYPRLAPA